MKTPRELLFQRHQAAEPKLDGLRRSVIAAQFQIANIPTRTRASLIVRLWQELFMPSRRMWAGLAAVWAVLLVVNLSQREKPSGSVVPFSSPVGATMTLYNQEKMFNDLLADRALPADVIVRQKSAPKPRSEISEIIAL